MSDAMAQVEATRERLKRMLTLLDEERCVLAVLDAARLLALAAEKREAFERLAAEKPPAPIQTSDAKVLEARAELKALAEKVQLAARVNALLIDDAVAAVAERRGVSRAASTYDARARTRPSWRPGRGKAA